MSSASARWVSLLTGLLALGPFGHGICGCAGAQSGSAQQSGAALEHLPIYDEQQARLFDDTFAPAVFGMPAQADPARDPIFQQRARSAEIAGRMKISTVTRDTSAGQTSYRLVLRPVQAVEATNAGVLELEIPPGAGSVGLLASHEASLAGKTVFVFASNFNDQGEPRLHFRVEADTESVRNAAEQARMLGELSE